MRNDAVRYADMSWWWPILQSVDVPVPDTRLILVDEDLSSILDGVECPAWPAFMEALDEAATEIADEWGYPVFLRTGQGSGKHEWENTCFVPYPDELDRHAVSLIEWSAMVDVFGLDTSTWAVRRYYIEDPDAVHVFQGMPLRRERRWWVADGEVEGWHPYWPPDSLDGISNPYKVLADLEVGHIRADEEAILGTYAQRVAEAFDDDDHDSWSVDFMWTDEDGWVCIDMAPAELSWRWESNMHYV